MLSSNKKPSNKKRNPSFFIYPVLALLIFFTGTLWGFLSGRQQKIPQYSAEAEDTNYNDSKNNYQYSPPDQTNLVTLRYSTWVFPYFVYPLPNNCLPSGSAITVLRGINGWLQTEDGYIPTSLTERIGYAFGTNELRFKLLGDSYIYPSIPKGNKKTPDFSEESIGTLIEGTYVGRYDEKNRGWLGIAPNQYVPIGAINGFRCPLSAVISKTPGPAFTSELSINQPQFIGQKIEVGMYLIPATAIALNPYIKSFLLDKSVITAYFLPAHLIDIALLPALILRGSAVLQDAAEGPMEIYGVRQRIWVKRTTGEVIRVNNLPFPSCIPLHTQGLSTPFMPKDPPQEFIKKFGSPQAFSNMFEGMSWNFDLWGIPAWRVAAKYPEYLKRGVGQTTIKLLLQKDSEFGQLPEIKRFNMGLCGVELDLWGNEL